MGQLRKAQGNSIIEDNVHIARGAKVLHAVRAGTNAVTGASAVVGVPARTISFNGSANYSNRTEYEAPRCVAPQHA